MRQSAIPAAARGPFLHDPDAVASDHVARAVGTPMRQVAAIHIDLAIHHAEVSRASAPRARSRAEARA